MKISDEDPLTALVDKKNAGISMDTIPFVFLDFNS
jgi:hypothetical protein